MTINVVDLFCGVGGLSYGLKSAELNVLAGIDVDHRCKFPYEENNEADFHLRDISQITAAEILDLFPKEGVKVLVGCAPCQPFSTYNQKNSDPKWNLVAKFSELIAEVKPDIVSMENVPRLEEFGGGGLFIQFKEKLEAAGYKVWHSVVALQEYGLPQQRRRLVLLASKHGEIQLDSPPDSIPNTSVRKAIASLSPIEAGSFDKNDPLHRSARLSDINAARIRASRPGSSWGDWPKKLVAPCHTKVSGKGYRSVYGRMEWDKPSPTITTQFFGFGNGRFGHPEQDRAISLREGAILQSFPPKYRFVENESEITVKGCGTLIGNAVPPLLGEVIGNSIKRHVNAMGLV